MAASVGICRLLNPFVLHLKKMELELNCPACLKLLSQPMLLPCDHILCSCCSETSRNNGYNCPVCIMPYERKDLRAATHVERFLNIYKSMSSTVTTLQQSSSFDISDPEVHLTKNPNPCKNYIGKKCTHMTEDECFVEREQLSPPTDNLRDSDSDSCVEEVKLVAKRKLADAFLDHEPIGDNKHARLNDSTESKDLLTGTHTKDGSNIETCAFCHSFRTTEASGDMLHYLNGKPVLGDQTSLPNVLHVHRKCIYWAPQIYFSGETIINLEVELSRSSKLKCWSCGLKGAALGCYVKSCRKTYHVPCAYEILECRWDIENYLVLCPTHASCKLPCDRPKSKKLTDSSLKPSLPSDYDIASLSKHATRISSSKLHEDWLICGSDLSKEEKTLLGKFSLLSRIPVTYQWKEDVTHVVAATNEHGACIRTMKYLMAILTGRWVLNMGWINACLEAQDLVPEEKYEVTHDVHGCFEGPKSGRIRAAQQAPKLFNLLAFHFSGFIEPKYKSNLEELAVAAGGKTVSHLEQPSQTNFTSYFVVCCVEPPKDCDPMHVDKVVRERLMVAEALAAKTGATVIRHTLFLNAIVAYDLHMLSER